MSTTKNVYTRNFNKLEKLGIIDLITSGQSAAKSESSGFMDLHFDRLYEEDGTIVIALAHYFKQNGDMCCDPDMQLRVYPEHRMAEALTFQQALPPVYRSVYPAPGKVNPRLKKELNSFLSTWLRNCVSQGHRFTSSVEG